MCSFQIKKINKRLNFRTQHSCWNGPIWQLQWHRQTVLHIKQWHFCDSLSFSDWYNLLLDVNKHTGNKRKNQKRQTLNRELTVSDNSTVANRQHTGFLFFQTEYFLSLRITISIVWNIEKDWRWEIHAALWIFLVLYIGNPVLSLSPAVCSLKNYRATLPLFAAQTTWKRTPNCRHLACQFVQ